MASQLELWWTRVRSNLLADEALAAGNRLMLEDSTATRSGSRVEIRGGTIPMTSPLVAELVLKRCDEDKPPLPEPFQVLIVDALPPGWLDQSMQRQRTKDGRVRG